MEKELVNLLQAGYDLYRLQSGFGPISPEIDKAVANFDNRLNQLADMADINIEEIENRPENLSALEAWIWDKVTEEIEADLAM